MTKKEIILLSLIGLLFLVSRILFQIPAIFTPDGILPAEVDPYYHMRLVENMIKNFPVALNIDQYARLGGGHVGYYPIVSWTIASLSLIIGLGNPSTDLIRIVGVLIPPIIGLLCLLPLYLIGRRLFNKETGIVACVFATILPTEFFHRSLLGFTDHHVFECLFCLLTVYFLIRTKDCKETKTSLINILGLGVSLGIYLLNWWGSFFFLAIVLLWLVIQSLVDKLRNINLNLAEYRNYTLGLALAGILTIPVIQNAPDPRLYLVTTLMFLLPLTIYFLKKATVVTYIVVHIVILATVISLIYLLGITHYIEILLYSVFGGFGSSISEAASMTLDNFVNVFGVATFFALGGVFFWIWKERGFKGNLLFFIFSIIMLVASISQRRWSYYLVFPMAIYSGFFLVVFVSYLKQNLQKVALTLVTIMTVLISITGSFQVATSQNLITPDWNHALVWLKDNSPEPFENENIYYELDSKIIVIDKEDWINSPSVAKYSVLSWWDYGHWIIYLSHRVPLVSPTLQILPNAEIEHFLTAQTTKEALNQIKDFKVKYIIIDEDMITRKYYAYLSRYMPATPEQIEASRPNSMVVRIWTESEPNFKLVYRNSTVKIFEVIK